MMSDDDRGHCIKNEILQYSFLNMTTEINEKSGIAAVCRRIAKSNFFEYFILGVILVAAALVGIETYYIEPAGVAPHVSQVGDAQFWLDIMNQVVLWVFVLGGLHQDWPIWNEAMVVFQGPLERF